MHTIYLVRKDDKPVYVGYTSRDINERWNEHCTDSKKQPKFPLHHAIRKYGIDLFSVEMIYQSEDRDHTLNFMEHHFIWLYKTYIERGGYNMTTGGEGGGKGLTTNELKNRKKARNKAWLKINKDKALARDRAYYEENKDKVISRNKSWREANRDKIKDKTTKQAKAWREANKEHIKAYKKAYYKAHKLSLSKICI